MSHRFWKNVEVFLKPTVGPYLSATTKIYCSIGPHVPSCPVVVCKSFVPQGSKTRLGRAGTDWRCPGVFPCFVFTVLDLWFVPKRQLEVCFQSQQALHCLNTTTIFRCSREIRAHRWIQTKFNSFPETVAHLYAQLPIVLEIQAF